MKCAKCGQDNPSEALFCMRCGAKLERKCPECGAEYPSEALFCMKCGTRLSNNTSAPEQQVVNDILGAEITSIQGENRLLSILYGDISGSVATIEKMVPEHAADLVSKCLQVMVNVIKKYDGTINRYLGDSVLAFFGIPDAHENDPERAILAALEMRDAVTELNQMISIGVNTGMIYFGGIGPDIHRESTGIGTAVNIAARLQGAADAGQILVGESTYRSTRRSFEFRALPPLTLRGIPNPVSAYEPLRALPRPEKIRGIEGIRAELIGREKELTDLKECADNLLAGKGQIVSVIGEAGVGKSRLLAELKRYIRDKEIMYLEGGCVSMGEPIGYRVFIDILRSYLEFSEEDSSEEMAGKIVNRVSALFPQRWEDVVPYIGNLLSVRFGNEWDKRVKYLPPDQVRQQTDQVKYQLSLALRDLFVYLANQRPLLLILEDLHWADKSSLDVLSLMMDELADVPLMLICIYRPEQTHGSWRIGLNASRKCPGQYTEIRLQELLPQESLHLVESLGSLLQIESLPEKVKETILLRAGGNPLFVEEVIRSLIDGDFIYQDGDKWVAKANIEDIAVPDTVQSVIMARVDQLEAGIRRTLHCASVIGNIFRRRLLQHITQHQEEQELDTELWLLEEKNIVYEQQVMPEVEYSFRHALIQETLYQNMLSRERQALHQKVGAGIEQLYPDRIEEFYEELAWHYSRGNDPPKAIDYSLKAGDKAKVMHAYQEARLQFERALEFIQKQPVDENRFTQEMAAREALGDVLFTMGVHHEAKTQLNHALTLASKQQDAQHLAALTCKLADLVHWEGDFDRAIEIAESGLVPLSDQIQSSEAISLLEVITRSYWAKLDMESARCFAGQMAQIIHQIPYFDSIYRVYYALFYVEMAMNDLQAASNWLEEMQQVCLTYNNEVGLARCYHGMGDLYQQRNDSQQASEWLERSLTYCERAGEAHLLLEGHLELAYHLVILNCDPDRIEEHIQRGVAIAEQMADNSQVASAPGLFRQLVDAFLEKKNIESATLCYRRSIQYGPPSNHPSFLQLLSGLEQLCAEQNQYEAFLDFCEWTQQEIVPQSQRALIHWHLEPGFASPDYSQTVWYDTFESPSLRDGWEWLDPQGKSSYDFVQKGVLELRTSAGHDLFSADSDAPRLVHHISGDFAAEVGLVDLKEKESQVGGLVLWTSESAYLSFAKRFPNANEIRLETWQQDQREIASRGWLPGHQLYLRLERCGESVLALCSGDGKEWQSSGKALFPVDGPVWIGLYVASRSTPSSSMRFKEFKLFQPEVK